MLRTQLIHPGLLAAVAAAGHGSRILLADGNYPHATGRPADCPVVHLNVAPGLLSVPQVLGPLLSVLPVEAATVMRTADGGPAEAHLDYARMLGDVPIEPLERFAFYAQAQERDTALLIATGDRRHYANLLLTVGVVDE